jgi:N-acetylneuraminate synthase/sialic acid synthase
MRRIVIAEKEISDETEPFVIAEIGHNHQGSLATCLQMIQAAAFSGASAVKLQKRDNKSLFTPDAYDAPYNSENAYGPTYGTHRDALEFGKEEYQACIEEAKRSNVVFFSTAFDYKSADFLEELDVPAYKIASGDLRSIPLLRYVASFGKPMIVSTGGATLRETDLAVETISATGTPFALLQCTAGYPPKHSELNLRVIETYRNRYPEIVVGYSGHDSGIAMALVSYLLGARVIEKHFTLNRAMKGTDHSFSLEPTGMRKMVRDLSRAKEALGDGVKVVYESEKAPVTKMGKMIIPSRDILKGEKVSEADFEIRSPAVGLDPTNWDQIIGKRTKRNLTKFSTLSIEDFEI